jgi:hypothetical protein
MRRSCAILDKVDILQAEGLVIREAVWLKLDMREAAGRYQVRTACALRFGGMTHVSLRNVLLHVARYGRNREGLDRYAVAKDKNCEFI